MRKNLDVYCDFVQLPDNGDPNYGSCLASNFGPSQEVIENTAKEARKYAKTGKIQVMVYADDTVFGEAICDSVDEAEKMAKQFWANRNQG
jgi:hypothetical protein